MERDERAAVDRLGEAALIHQVVATEGEEVSSVHALRRGGEAEPKTGTEVVDRLAIGRGRCVVELVDDDVVELVSAEGVEVPGE